MWAHLLRKGVKGRTVGSQTVVLSNRIFTHLQVIFSVPQCISSLAGLAISEIVLLKE
jgi:hypothetical protein